MNQFEPYIILGLDAGQRCYKRGDPEVREFDGVTYSFVGGIEDVQIPGSQISVGKSATLGSGKASFKVFNDGITPGSLLTTYARVQGSPIIVYLVSGSRETLIFEGEVVSVTHDVSAGVVTITGGPVSESVTVPFPSATTLEEGRLITRQTKHVEFESVYDTTFSLTSPVSLPFYEPKKVEVSAKSTSQSTAFFVWLKDNMEFKTLFGTPSNPQYAYASPGDNVEFALTEIQQLDGSDEYGNITDPGTFLWWESSAKDEPIPIIYGRNPNVSLKPFAHYRIKYQPGSDCTAVGNTVSVRQNGNHECGEVDIIVTNNDHFGSPPQNPLITVTVEKLQNTRQSIQVTNHYGLSYGSPDIQLTIGEFLTLANNRYQQVNGYGQSDPIQVKGPNSAVAEWCNTPFSSTPTSGEALFEYSLRQGLQSGAALSSEDLDLSRDSATSLQYFKIYIYPVACQRIIGDDRLVGSDPKTIAPIGESQTNPEAAGFTYKPDFFLALRWGDNQKGADSLSAGTRAYRGAQLGYIDNDGKDGTIAYVTLPIPYQAPTYDEDGNVEIEEWSEIKDDVGQFTAYKGFTPQDVYALLVKGKQKQGAEPIASLGDVIHDAWSTFGSASANAVDWQLSSRATERLNAFNCDMVINKVERTQTLSRILNSRLSGQFPVAFGYPRGRLAWQCTAIPILPPSTSRHVEFGVELTERVSISESNKSEIQNVVNVQFGIDGTRNGTRFSASLNPETSNAAKASKARWGRSKMESIQVQDTQDPSTAAMIAEQVITLKGGIRLTATYTTDDPSFVELPPLSIVTITDEAAEFHEEKFFYLGYKWGANLASLSVSFLSVEMV